MTTTQGAEMSVTVNNSPFQDYRSCMFTLQAIMLHLLIKWLLDSNILQFYIQLPYHQVAISWQPNHWSVVLQLSVNGHLSRYHLCTINIMKMKALFLARSHLVGSSLLSELLNWPWARTKLPLKLKSGRPFNKDLINFCCCLALVLKGISLAKLDYL